MVKTTTIYSLKVGLAELLDFAVLPSAARTQCRADFLDSADVKASATQATPTTAPTLK